MARPLRVEYPGAFYHVINRGNNQEIIFKNDRDREKFLEYLQKANERFSIVFHTYCLMSNHFHLLASNRDAVSMLTRFEFKKPEQSSSLFNEETTSLSSKVGQASTTAQFRSKLDYTRWVSNLDLFYY